MDHRNNNPVMVFTELLVERFRVFRSSCRADGGGCTRRRDPQGPSSEGDGSPGDAA